MPTYEYVCDNCGNKFETFQSIKADPLIHCDVCGKDALRKVISGGAGLIFKGSGFYLTDYKNKPSESSSASSSSNSTKKETKSTETKTDSKTESKSESSKSSTSTDKSSSASSTESKPSSDKKK